MTRIPHRERADQYSGHSVWNESDAASYDELIALKQTVVMSITSKLLTNSFDVCQVVNRADEKYIIEHYFDAANDNNVNISCECPEPI